MFRTLTLNPCIDRAVFVKSFTAGGLNREYAHKISAGGKGINVSRMLTALGADNIAYTLLGGGNGETIIGELDKSGINYGFIPTKAETRMNIKIIPDDGSCTELNSSGGPINSDEIDRLISKIEAETEEGDIFIMSGSVPNGVEKDIYRRIGNILLAKKCLVYLDCDGVALEEGIKAGITGIKPNLDELNRLVKNELSDMSEIARQCNELYKTYSNEVICTLGGKGAIYAGAEGVFRVDSPKVKIRGLSAAGDTFLASFLFEKYQKREKIEQCLAFASAAAAAKITLEGADVPSPELIEKYLTDRKVEKIIL